MKTLFTTDYKNYNPQWPSSSRPSARAVILIQGEVVEEGFGNSSNVILHPQDKIALVYAKNLGYYKFPGGGINEGEDNVTALIREVEEETGLEVIKESVKEYGVARRTMESGLYKETIFIQDSLHYFCRVRTNDDGTLYIKKQHLDQYEKEEGFELKVVSISQAIETNIHFKTDDIKQLDMINRENLVMSKMCGLPELLPRAFAQNLLEKGVSKNPGPWRDHSYAVAQAAEKIARNTKTLNPDFAYVCGLLHDIGRQEGYTYMAHVYDGYHYLKNLGYELIPRVCLTHSFNLKTIDDYIGKVDVTQEQYEELKTLLANIEYDDYDRLIQLLDSCCGADGTRDLEKRMSDVKARYGYYPQAKWDKNFELKEYFEKMMGKPLYEVIA